jgi:sugar phosphate isomerase/epimerase
MRLKHNLHLAYSTNVHRGEDWAETLASLERHTLAVKRRVSPDRPFAIGLRLSERASAELSEADRLKKFREWLERNDCYVFTINGFPFGRFHGVRVKEEVYRPDWTSPERLAYTNRLFDLLAQLVPEGVEGSVSTLPGSFKEFITSPEQGRQIRDNVWRCVEHIARVSEHSGRKLHLAVEPEPLGWFENTVETLSFFKQLRDEHDDDPRISEHLGVNYDTCHFAIEFEEPAAAIGALRRADIRISKLHLSSALKVRPTVEARRELGAFADDVYLHQVVAATAGARRIYRDLPVALADGVAAVEWRVHFHVPLHSPATDWYETTTEHVTGVLDLLRADPGICSHLEMETYTWEVLPAALRNRSVEDQLSAEYDWTLLHLKQRGLA